MKRAAITLPMLALALLAAAGAWGATPQSLVDSGELRAGIVIDSEAPYYQRVPLILAVEVATPRWFSRGTRVRDFRIPGAIVLPMSSFASNLTRRERGTTWTVQRWRFRVFAAEAGALALPPLRVFVSVNHDGSAVEGELTLRHPPLNVAPPPGAPAGDNWLAAASLTVSERWEGQREDYRVGDAFTRVRHIEADNAPAMMIPRQPPSDIEGLSLYAAPAAVDDTTTRGSLRGVREESLVVTLEAPGEYVLPGATYRWFDTNTGSMREETLPEYRFSVSGAAPSVDNIAEPRALPWWIAGALVIFAAAGMIARRVRRSAFAAALGRRWSRWRDHRHYLRAATRGDSMTALRLLHRSARPATDSLRAAVRGQQAAAAGLERLLGAFEPGAAPGRLSRAEARALWAAVCEKRRRRETTAVLTLNPTVAGD